MGVPRDLGLPLLFRFYVAGHGQEQSPSRAAIHDLLGSLRLPFTSHGNYESRGLAASGDVGAGRDGCTGEDESESAAQGEPSRLGSQVSSLGWYRA